jgi:hypothetical protein
MKRIVLVCIIMVSAVLLFTTLSKKAYAQDSGEAKAENIVQSVGDIHEDTSNAAWHTDTIKSLKSQIVEDNASIKADKLALKAARRSKDHAQIKQARADLNRDIRKKKMDATVLKQAKHGKHAKRAGHPRKAHKKR